MTCSTVIKIQNRTELKASEHQTLKISIGSTSTASNKRCKERLELIVYNSENPIIETSTFSMSNEQAIINNNYIAYFLSLKIIFWIIIEFQAIEFLLEKNISILYT
jgi:hypothetical protein